jgi:hypothetical protein
MEALVRATPISGILLGHIANIWGIGDIASKGKLSNRSSKPKVVGSRAAGGASEGDFIVCDSGRK